MKQSSLLAGNIDPWKDFDVRICSPEQLYVGFVIQFVILDYDVLRIEG